MYEILNPLNTSWSIWWVTVLCALVSGLSKGGLKGFAMINIPILAQMYGGMQSSGILLPFLLFGDTFALLSYKQKPNWSYVKVLLPSALLGILAATLVGKYVNDTQFKYSIGIATLCCLMLLIYSDISQKKKKEKKEGKSIMQTKAFSYSLGFTGGFATMIGNAAGPIFNLYLMAMRLPKEVFITTGAMFYLVLNFTKVPLHVFYWHSITWDTLQLNFICLPILIAGAFIGKKIVKHIPELFYRRFVMVVVGVSALLLFF